VELFRGFFLNLNGNVGGLSDGLRVSSMSQLGVNAKDFNHLCTHISTSPSLAAHLSLKDFSFASTLDNKREKLFFCSLCCGQAKSFLFKKLFEGSTFREKKGRKAKQENKNKIIARADCACIKNSLILIFRSLISFALNLSKENSLK
jgi:hypothetical protein